MLFNSIPFLFFFAIVAAVYFVIPYRFRWVLLLAASYYFYMTTKPGFVVFILLSTFSTYYAGIQMGKTKLRSKRKKFLLLGLLFNLGLLFLLKYYNFFNDSLRVVFAHFHSVYKIPAFHVLLPAPIFRSPSPSFGEGGTFLSLHGSGIISIFQWGGIAFPFRGGILICL